jgi:hypothetical protein
VIYAKHREVPLRNGAPTDGNASMVSRFALVPESSDVRVVYEIVLRFTPPRESRPDRNDGTRIGSQHRTGQGGAAIFIVSNPLSAPSVGPVSGLAQGEEPGELGDDQGARSRVVNS